jgi:hypothetical protein
MGVERDRIERGPDPGESPPGDATVLSFACPSGAVEVLERVREVLIAVVPAPRPWPTLDEWRERLPAWFVEACSDDVVISTCVVDRWSLRAWIWWFQPEQRRWTWWDGQATGDQLAITLVPTGAGSLLLGALEWLVEASGATVPKG